MLNRIVRPRTPATIDDQLQQLADQARAAGELETSQVLCSLLIARKTGRTTDLYGRCVAFCDDVRRALRVKG